VEAKDLGDQRTVKEGTHSTTLTLVGSYTSGNFIVTPDGHGGTLITDPPVPGAVVTSAATSSSMADIAAASFAPLISSSVISGGYQVANGGAAEETDSGGTDRGAFFSGGGMVQLDALSQFAGVISGFDLGNALDLRSLGFGSSSSAASWTPHASGADGGASGIDKAGLFSLTLLGQYAANFGASSDGHGGSMITDPTSGSVAPTPLIAHQ
jgi:hypothetical protein